MLRSTPIAKPPYLPNGALLIAKLNIAVLVDNLGDITLAKRRAFLIYPDQCTCSLGSYFWLVPIHPLVCKFLIPPPTHPFIVRFLVFLQVIISLERQL